MTAPHSLAEAWALELQDRGATMNDHGAEGAQSLFYAGAAAMFAMAAAAGPDRHSLFGLFAQVKAELELYLNDAD